MAGRCGALDALQDGATWTQGQSLTGGALGERANRRVPAGRGCSRDAHGDAFDRAIAAAVLMPARRAQPSRGTFAKPPCC